MMTDFSLELARDFLFAGNGATTNISALAPNILDLSSVLDPVPGNPVMFRCRVTSAGASGVATLAQVSVFGTDAGGLNPGVIAVSEDHILSSLTVGKTFFMALQAPWRTTLLPSNTHIGIGELIPGYKLLRAGVRFSAATPSQVGLTIEVVSGLGDTSKIYPASFNPRIGN